MNLGQSNYFIYSFHNQQTEWKYVNILSHRKNTHILKQTL